MNTSPLDCPSLEGLKTLFSGCGDFTIRKIDFGLEGDLTLPVCWLDGAVSGETVGQEILRPLTDLLRAGRVRSAEAAFSRILAGGVYRCSVRERRELSQAAEDLCRGCCLVLFETPGCALSFESKSTQRRAVAEPTLEKSLKGGKDSFTETLRVNTALVRNLVFFHSLERMEASVVGLWILPDFLLASLCLQTAQRCLRTATGHPPGEGEQRTDLGNGRFLIWLCAVLSASLALLPQLDPASLLFWSRTGVPLLQLAVSFLLIPGITLACRRKEKKNSGFGIGNSE